MAATAHTQSALVVDPSPWPLRPTAGRGRREYQWAAAGLVGIGLLAAAIVTLTVRASTVPGDPTHTGGPVDGSASQSSLVGGYSSLVGDYQSARHQWSVLANRIVPGSSSSAESLIRPTVQFADTVDRLDKGLVQLPWPPSMRRAVKTLETDLASVSGDLRSIGGQSVSSMPQWISNVVQDASTSSAASDRLTRELGRTSASAS